MLETQNKKFSLINKPKIYFIATAHLDTVWNWDLEQTVKEFIPQTLNKNFYLIEKYKEYRFNFEGAYRYKLIKEFYPEQYDKLKEYVKKGRWCPTGSAWESGDVIVPSPEALTRNFLYGNRFFKQEFGFTTNDVFLPDCFGFSFALPSIAAHMGLVTFSSAKLIWGSGNFVPFDVGVWYGPDGSSLIAALNPCQYISDISADYQNNESTYERISKLAAKKYMRYYGVGDMGGAPNEESVKNLCDGIEDASSSIELVSAYSSQLANEMTQNEFESLPTYEGELLMTTHAVGTYTSRGILKRLNRRNEILADLAERVNIMSDYYNCKPYPKLRFENAWKQLIAHQFHDDITGTSTNQVYLDTINDYVICLNEFSHEIASACENIAERIDTSDIINGIPIIVFNGTQYSRTEIAEFELTVDDTFGNYVRVFDSDNNEVPVQICKRCGNKLKLAMIVQVPAVGYAAYSVCPSDKKMSVKTGLTVTKNSLENERYKVTINRKGDVSKIYDKVNKRQLLIKPLQFEILKNSPREFGSWEIGYDDIQGAPTVVYDNNAKISIIEAGSVRGTIQIEKTFMNSTYCQTISIFAGSDRVEFNNTVYWHETASLLKARFELNSTNETALYDGGIGVADIKSNNKDKYEIAANRWICQKDSTDSYQISIMSDCKYGWDKPDDNTLRLSLIHTPYGKWNDNARQDMQDFGENRFGFAITGDYSNNENINLKAECYNNPLIVVQTTQHKGYLKRKQSFVSISHEGIIVRSIKRAEDSGDIVIRLCEMDGNTKTFIQMEWFDNIINAFETDGNETFLKAACINGNKLIFNLKPYETKTFAIRIKEFDDNSMINTYKPIKLPCNCKISSTNQSKGDYGFGENRVTIPSEQMESEYLCGGIPFINSPYENDFGALTCDGQEISLPTGTKSIFFVAASLNGDKSAEFLLDNIKKTIDIQSFTERIGGWDQVAINHKGIIKRDVLAFHSTHTHTSNGDAVLGKAYLFKYKLEHGDNIKKIILPKDNDIIITSITAQINSSNTSKMISETYDYKQ